MNQTERTNALDAIPTIVGAALLTLAAASADAQQTKEMLTHDPNVLQGELEAHQGREARLAPEGRWAG